MYRAAVKGTEQDVYLRNTLKFLSDHKRREEVSVRVRVSLSVYILP